MPEQPEVADSSRGENWTRVERIVDRFEDAWRQGQRPVLADYLIGDDDLMPE